ncbi:MAG: hypothetical protein DI556_21255 [Rhodovulum sulfidophilum]|uniref:Type IV secretion system protein VirB10 n=1 Tax=Rhodovulum sulfidophilum TaxID=35806 RepID=A0A2W5PN40_RHOSU|nr:MAG: hypothetical protein DI556_21255 [Rhodovulum sulfidophilum]
MTDQRPEDLDRLARIAERDGPGTPGRAPRLVLGAGFALLFAGATVWAFAPSQMRTLLGLGTSEAEKMQREAAPLPGLSTEIPRDAGPIAPPPPLSTDLPMRAPPEPGASQTETRLAALEAGLRTMNAREAGPTRAELQSMLDANAAAIRADVTRQLLSRQPPVAAGINPGGDTEAAKRAEEERARQAAIEAAQVSSRGLVIDGAAGGVPVGSGASGDGRRRSGDEGFLSAAASAGHETVRAGALADPSRTVVQGTILEGVLETALSTDLPGAVRAVLSQDVLSYDGSTTLLPKGTRLIGTYGSQVKIAQRRALVAWSRAITPEGVSVALGGIGADALGRSGQTGQVDTHFWERFGSAALISIFGLAPQVLIDDATNGDAADAIEDIGDDLRAATSGALDAYLRISPTINVSQGDRLTIFVNRDLTF